MDAILQAIILLLGVPGVVISVRRTGDWINPVTMLFVFFFLPIFFSLFRLSGLQSHHWHYNTYIAIFTSIGAWLIFPVIVIAAHSSPKQGKQDLLFLDIFKSPYFVVIVRVFGIVIFSSFILSNYIQAGHVLAFNNAEAAFQIHTVFPFGLRYFARAGVAGVTLLYVAYWAQRRHFDLVLLLLVLLVPLSRLSRFDVALGMIALTILFTSLPIFKLSSKKWLFILAALALVIVAGAELGSLRQNRFDKYDFKYSSFIAWQPQLLGPAEVLPILYGYFCLPFENLDYFIKQFNGSYGIALASFDWLFTGFLKLNWYTSYGFAQAEHFQFVPISSAANVAGALTPFYSDLGPIGMALPMTIYIVFWLYLYYRSKSSARSLLLYAIYSSAFSLVSFQAIIAAAFLFHQMLEVIIVIALVTGMERYRRKRLDIIARKRILMTAARFR